LHLPAPLRAGLRIIGQKSRRSLIECEAVEPLTIFCNSQLPGPSAGLLHEGVAPHRLLLPAGPGVFPGKRGQPDPQLTLADVAFGQPDVDQVIAAPRLRWVHLNSAGYTSYDRDDLRQAFRQRGAALTKSSLVYDEPCAQQVLAFMCAHTRQLPGCYAEQAGARRWPQLEVRRRCRLLHGESAVIVGFGSIGHRLVELLAPFAMRITAIRRKVAGDEPVPTCTPEDPRADRALAEADHVIDLLPAAPGTEKFFDGRRLGGLKPGAVFYNVGRGTTVDQEALLAALTSGRLAAAYLDVTTPEPLPPDHPLWTAPGCFVTPHIAGGHDTEGERLVAHFLDNLRRVASGTPLLDRAV
jgi:phosphoglycerate dehydrogenase-like enzyme